MKHHPLDRYGLATMTGLALIACTEDAEQSATETTDGGTQTSSVGSATGGLQSSTGGSMLDSSTTSSPETFGSTVGDSTGGDATRGGSETNGTDDTQGDSTTGAGRCRVATISGPLILDPGTAGSYRAVGEFSETPGVDTFLMQFYAPDVGVFDLGSGVNSDFATCTQCIVFREDDQTPPGPRYYQSEGSLELDAGSAPLGGVVNATLVGVTLVESTFDPNSTPPFASMPVPGGGCFVIEDVTLSYP